MVQPGMQIVADANLLRTAMQSLLDNAWKYTSKAADARVEIGSFNVRAMVFFVRDNGAGFNPAYSSRLFGVFQRLHTAEEFQVPASVWRQSAARDPSSWRAHLGRGRTWAARYSISPSSPKSGRQRA